MFQKIDNESMEVLKLIKESDYNSMTIKEVLNRTSINHPQKLYNRLSKLIKLWYITEDYEFIKFPDENKIILPFYGWAQCGNNWSDILEDYPKEKLEIDTELNNIKIKQNQRYFVTRAKGKSMEPEIKSWDNLLIRMEKNYNFNDNFLLIHKQKPKVKKIKQEAGKIFLISLNPDFPDLEIKKEDSIDIIWVVENVIKF